MPLVYLLAVSMRVPPGLGEQLELLRALARRRAITDQFAKRQRGWQVELHTCGWDDPTAGLQDRTADAAFVWLPIDAAGIETEVLATEPRFVAICIPVRGLEPARLIIAWRRGDRRLPVRDFVQACRDAAGAQHRNLQATYSD